MLLVTLDDPAQPGHPTLLRHAGWRCAGAFVRGIPALEVRTRMSWSGEIVGYRLAASNLVRLEGFPATAALLGIGVVEYEGALQQGFVVVERHALQIFVALGIDENLHPFVLEDVVGGARLRLQLEFVAQTGTAASHHAQPEPTLDMVRLQGLANLRDGFGVISINVAPSSPIVPVQ